MIEISVGNEHACSRILAKFLISTLNLFISPEQYLILITMVLPVTKGLRKLSWECACDESSHSPLVLC